MAGTLGILNPLTYRGYVYDHETGLYYLQSRYYNPEWGRFLNADALVSTGGLLGNNMFAYCGNNPVTRSDPYGTASVDCYDDRVDLLDDAFDDVVGGGRLIVGAVKTGVGLVVGGVVAIAVDELQRYIAEKKRKKQKGDTTPPDVTYPGDDPLEPPGDDYEWRGKLPVGGDEGAWVNPEGESLHPDLNHSGNIGPHWDYNYKGSGHKGWRIFPNGDIVLKAIIAFVISVLEASESYE